MTIYNPARFSVSDLEKSFQFMESHPFATVISISEGLPVISHLPLVAKREGDEFVLIGHLARANPHARVLAEGAGATAIFHGPHAFITPKWYAHDDVPTWNYSTVHTVGQVTVIDEYEGIVECLRELSAAAERKWPSGWEFFVPEDLAREKLSKHILGFKIRVETLQHENKMGQKLSTEDQAGVIAGLTDRGDDNALAVRNAILELFPELADLAL